MSASQVDEALVYPVALPNLPWEVVCASRYMPALHWRLGRARMETANGVE